MFTGWIYDDLKPHAATLRVAHRLLLRAIAAAKTKNDLIDTSKNLQLPALRFPAGVLPGPDGDSRTTAGAALPQPAQWSDESVPRSTNPLGASAPG